MTLDKRQSLHASFVIAVTSAFIASICYIISFVSPYWIVAKWDTNEGFQRLGLWEVCFHDFIFPEDYVSKAYEGCWYIYYPEYKYIRFWLNPPWFYAVQILSILGLSCSLAGLLIIILTLCEVYGTKEKKPKITVITLEAITLCCLIVIVVTMGVMSKDRQWLPRSDHNRVSWSFAFAVISGFFTIMCLFGLFTHYLSVESRIMMEDPTLRQKLLGPESRYGYQKSVSGFDTGAGTESRLGGVPSLFTMPASGSQLGPGSGMIGAGTASHLSRATVAPGAVGPTTAGTSAAIVSTKLRETLEAQRAAVFAANARAADTGLPVTGAVPQSSIYSPSLYQMGGARTEPGTSGSLNRRVPSTGSMTHLHTTVAMDSTV